MNTEPALAYLRIIAPDGTERTLAITHSPFCIGRAGHNDLSLTDPQVSRNHACLRFEGDQIRLVDVGSENGTWLGSTLLEANQPQKLVYHDVFRIGSYRLMLEPSGVVSISRSPERADTVPTRAIASSPNEADDSAAAAPQPIGALIEASPNGQIGAWVKTPLVTVTPGNSTNISLVIINQSQSPDGFRVTIGGVPDLWLAAPPPLIELPAAGREEINLTLHPPRTPETVAGRYRLSILITSRNTPTERVEVRSELIIAPYAAFSSALRPQRIDAKDAAQVVVRNDGNTSQVFTVTWLDPENRFEFRPAELQMTLPAGETATTEFRVIPHHQRWFGGSRLDIYSIKVAPEEGAAQAHTGQIITTGALPTWTVALFLLVTLCGVASGVGALALMGDSNTTPTPTVITSLTPMPIITPTLILTGTASGIDSDGDGLPDEEETRLGTDPHNPDTDRDGLTDLDEIRRGTSPTLSDSDGDGLLDGQEAFGCSDPRNPDTDGDGLRDNVDPDPCRLPTTTPAPTATPVPTITPPPTNTPLPTLTPLPTNTPLPTSVPVPTNTPLPQPTPIITDWRGEYYGNADLLGAPLVVRNDLDINFNWGRTAPDPVVPADNFSIRWTRTLNFESRAYRFSVRADDGVRVFIDDNPIINEWHPATPLTYTADVTLTAGPHVIRVEYYEGVFDAYVLFWFEPAP